MAEITERELNGWMARLADGDRSAFDPLFLALHPRAVRFARNRVGESHAADVAQATLMKLFSHAQEFEPGRSVLAWFYAIAVNEARAVQRQEARPALPDLEQHTTDPDRELLERELLDALNQAIDSLDEVSAEAIRSSLLRTPPPQVAPAALRKRVSRAYARLRVLLRGYDER